MILNLITKSQNLKMEDWSKESERNKNIYFIQWDSEAVIKRL